MKKIIKPMKKINSSTKPNLNKLKIIYLFLFIIILILLTSYFVIRSFPEPKHIENLEYDFKVQKEVGFVLDSDALHFGNAPVNSTSNRNITINSEFDALVKIFFDGPANLIVNENNFVLEKNTNKSLEFTLTVPDLPEGKYKGNVQLQFFELN